MNSRDTEKDRKSGNDIFWSEIGSGFREPRPVTPTIMELTELVRRGQVEFEPFWDAFHLPKTFGSIN